MAKFWQNFLKSSAPPKVEIKFDELVNIIIATLRDGIIVYDSNFKILVFNKAAEQIFNLKSENIVGRNFTPDQIKNPSLKLLIDVLYPSLAPVVIRHSESGTYPQIIDLSFEEPQIELKVITNKIIDSGGNNLGFLKVVVDRTRELEILRSKNEFISVAAHQLRTPLTGLHWVFESLANGQLSEDQKQIVDSGLELSSFVLKIVNDLLDVSKIEEGRFGYNFEKIDFVDFAEKIIGELKETIDKSGIKVYFQKSL